MTRFDLLGVRPLRAVLVSRWPMLIARAAALGGFLLVIVAGLIGTPVGNRNLGIVVVWIAWWAVLMLVAVPFLGRFWCGICPVPLPGEWLQQRAILDPPRGPRAPFGLARRWPVALRNGWFQNAAFVLMALISMVVLTDPRVTAILLAVLLLAATAAALTFERRMFCRHLCPIGGFIGLYGRVAPVELRVKDAALCAGHREKSCVTGSAEGFGCPWNVFAGGLVTNVNCGLCLECVRTCPHDNVVLNTRPFGADLVQPRGRRLDEAFKALILVGSAGAYTATMLGPWGWLKTAARDVGTVAWAQYSLGFLALVLGIVPAAFALAVWAGGALSGAREAGRRRFVRFAYSTVPLGLAAWIAFSLSLVFANGSYVWPVLSDPLGWGWNLLATVDVPWTPYLTSQLPWAQAAVVLGGLAWSGALSRRLAMEGGPPARAVQAAAPVVLFHFTAAVTLLWLLVA
jgi:polyferredoxin